jgi:hypothetical protein
LTPDSVNQRYDRMVKRLGIETTIHKLRHYSATELIAGGVDPRTVAGRLGHSGGGTTTLKAYTAWVSEADQRAAKGLGAGMPQRPAEVAEPDRIRAAPRFPYQVVAAVIARHITEGVLAAGDAAPPAVELAARHEVSLATAKRSLVLLTEWGLLERLGHNVLRVAVPSSAPVAAPAPVVLPSTSMPGAALLSLTVRRHGTTVAQFSTVADPTNASELHQVLAAAVVRAGGDTWQISEYEMDVRLPSEPAALLTFVASGWTS